MFDKSKYKNDLKIVVDNSNKQEDEILIIESGGYGSSALIKYVNGDY
jgi:hypothetical protein